MKTNKSKSQVSISKEQNCGRGWRSRAGSAGTKGDPLAAQSLEQPCLQQWGLSYPIRRVQPMTESCLLKETMPPTRSSALSSWLQVDLSEKLLKNNTDEPGNKAYTHPLSGVGTGGTPSANHP